MLKLLQKLLAPVTALALLVALAGCAGPAAGLPKDPSTFTEQNVRDVLAAAVANMLEASSFTAVYQATDRYTADAGSGPVTTESTVTATMFSDRVNGRAQVDLGITISLADAPDDSPPQTLDVNTYVYADYLYVKLDTFMELPWYKVPVTGSVLDVFSTRLIDNEISMFDLPAEVAYLRNETVAGTDCYVIRVVPNHDQFLKLAERHQPDGTAGFDWSRVQDLSKIYSGVSYTVWVSADTLRFVRAESQVEADFSGIAAFADNPALAGMTLASAGSVTFTDYNEKLVITLPEEARQAEEVAPDQLTP